MSDLIHYEKVTEQDKKFYSVVSKFTVLNLRNKFRVTENDGEFNLQATRANGRIYQYLATFDSLKEAENFIFTTESWDAVDYLEGT